MGFSRNPQKSGTAAAIPLFGKRKTHAGLFQPLGIELGVETDNKIILNPKGRGPQIAARSHHLLQYRSLFLPDMFKPLHLFPLGHGDRAGRFQQFPSLLGVIAGSAGIDDLLRSDLPVPKKLLGIGAGRSAFA